MRKEIKIDNLNITSINSIKEISKNKWNNFVEVESPLFDYEFLRSMEDSGCTSKEYGWNPNHIIIKEREELLCIIPNFIKLNSNGEYVDFFPPKIQSALIVEKVRNIINNN